MSEVTTLSLESIEAFRSSLLARGKSQQTAKAYTTDLRMLLRDLETDAISSDDYEECGMNWLTANRKTLEATTTNRRLASLRRFAVWAKWPVSFDDYNAPVPLAGKPHPLPEGIDGVKRMILFAPNHQEAALITLMGLMGLRVGETLFVRCSHFNTQRMMLTVYGKGDKRREVPVSDLAWHHLQEAVLRSYMTDDALLIPFKDRFARACVTRLGRTAGICRRVSSHDLRATFATEVYNKTKDIRLVQMLLGHSSSKQTEVYIGVSEAALKDGVVF